MRWPPQNQQHPSLRWAPPRPNTAEHGATTRPRSEAGATCSSSRRRSRGPPPGQWGGGSARLRRCRGETAAPAWHDAMSGPFISGAPRRHPGVFCRAAPAHPQPRRTKAQTPSKGSGRSTGVVIARTGLNAGSLASAQTLTERYFFTTRAGRREEIAESG